MVMYLAQSMRKSPPARTIAPMTTNTSRKPSDTAMLTARARVTRAVAVAVVPGGSSAASAPRKYER
jgi:hypothetical protein